MRHPALARPIFESLAAFGSENGQPLHGASSGWHGQPWLEEGRAQEPAPNVVKPTLVTNAIVEENGSRWQAGGGRVQVSSALPDDRCRCCTGNLPPQQHLVVGSSPRPQPQAPPLSPPPSPPQASPPLPLLHRQSATAVAPGRWQFATAAATGTAAITTSAATGTAAITTDAAPLAVASQITTRCVVGLCS